MSDYKLRLTVDTSQHDRSMQKAAGQVNYYANKVMGAKDKIMGLSKAIPAVALAVGGLSLAFKGVVGVMESADSTSDDLGRTFNSCLTIFNNFKSSLANANFDGFISNLGRIKDAADTAFDSADRLGTLLLESKGPTERWKAEYESRREIINNPDSTPEQVAEARQWISDNRKYIKILTSNIVDQYETTFRDAVNSITNNVFAGPYTNKQGVKRNFYEEKHLYGYNEYSRGKTDQNPIEDILDKFYDYVTDFTLAKEGETPWETIFGTVKSEIMSKAGEDINGLFELLVDQVVGEKTIKGMKLQNSQYKLNEVLRSGDIEKSITLLNEMSKEFSYLQFYDEDALKKQRYLSRYTEKFNANDPKVIVKDREYSEKLYRELVAATKGYVEIFDQLDVLANIPEDAEDGDKYIVKSKEGLVGLANSADQADREMSRLLNRANVTLSKKSAQETKAEEAAKEAAAEAKEAKKAAEEAIKNNYEEGSLTDLKNQLAVLEDEKQILINMDKVDELKDKLQEIYELQDKILAKEISLGLRESPKINIPAGKTSDPDEYYSELEKTEATETAKRLEEIASLQSTLDDAFHQVSAGVLSVSGSIVNLGSTLGDVFNSDEITEFFNTLQGGLDVLNGVLGVYEAITGLMDILNTQKQASIALTQAESAATAAQTAINAAETSSESGKAIAKATASGAGLVFPYNLVAIAAGIVAVVGALSLIGKFANGGIVGGNSTIGDHMLARVNSGEMILNKREQTRLFNVLSGVGSFGAQSSNPEGSVKFRISGTDLVGVLNNQGKKSSRVI